MNVTGSPTTSVWLTSAEAASYLRISRCTLLAWVREGRVVGHALHGVKRHTWRFRLEELDAAAIVITVDALDDVLWSKSPSAVSQQQEELR